MSMVSTGEAPPQQAPLAALPMEADPNGFTERAPALGSLLPDEALARALAGGDALAVHAALVARSKREPAGPARDTIRALLAQPALFAVSEVPPRLKVVLGIGTALVGLPPPAQQAEPFIATRVVRVLGMPVWPLSQHLVRRGREGKLEVLGRTPTGLKFRALRWVARVGIAATAIAVVGAGLSPWFMRELFIINGLSRPVVVQVDGKPVSLEPGRMTRQWKFNLGDPYHVTASWEGGQRPFEELSVKANQRTIYNVLGASAATLGESHDLSHQRGKSLEQTITDLSSSDELWVIPGGWERRVQELGDKDHHSRAAVLATKVAIADPHATRAREEAARYMVRLPPEQAQGIALQLYQQYPEDLAVGALVQDVLLAVGLEPEMRRFFSQPQFKEATSVQDALLYARARPADELRQAHDAVLARFPEAPEALRAVARLRLADGYPQRALELLEAARAKAPESFEDLELRVRTLVSLKQVREASLAVREYAPEPHLRTWEFAVLAGRLARLAGPERSQYLLAEFVPQELLSSQESRLAFSLLTGEELGKDLSPTNTKDPETLEAMELARLALQNVEAAVAQVQSKRDAVLRRLPLEAAAVLALELSIRKQPEVAERVFRTHFALMHGRTPLTDYVHRGEVHPRFSLLSPELQATAYLVRARSLQKEAFVQRVYARWADVLGGFARRALDPKYEEPAPREVKPVDGPQPALGARKDVIRIIRPGEERLEDLGPRVPRPWQ
jgi:hypothetical protein